MEGDPKFTIYWRTGHREVVAGRNAAEAMMLAGHGGGSYRAVDFIADGDDHKYAWVEGKWQSVTQG